MRIEPQRTDERQLASPDQAESFFQQQEQRELDGNSDQAGRGHEQSDHSPVAIDPGEKEKIDARDQQSGAGQDERGQVARQVHGKEV